MALCLHLVAKVEVCLSQTCAVHINMSSNDGLNIKIPVIIIYRPVRLVMDSLINS